MADKRIFTIQINGIKESCEQIDTLLQKLNELQKSVNDLSKSGAKIKIGGTVTVKDDTKKPKDNTDKEVKETANTLAGLRKELGALKKELANTELGTKQWEELRDKVSSANTKVKEIEQSYGVFSRNVGNYTNSFLAAFNKFPQSVQNTLSGLHNFNQNASSLGQQIRTVSKSMEELTANGEQNSEAFEALKEVYSELVKAQLDLNDAIDDAKDRSNGLKDVTEVFESITGAMQLAAGAASLFGANSEDAVKAIQKMQALQSIANGLRTLQTSLQRNGALWKLWQKSLAITDRLLGTTNKTVKATDATLKSTNTTIKATDTSLKATAASSKATAAGMTATATATRGASAAMNGLRIAIASTGIGLLVVALGTLVTKLMEFADWSEKAKRELKSFGSFIDSELSRNIENFNRKFSLGQISALELSQKKLYEYRVAVTNELDKLYLAIDASRNKWLSKIGNEFEGDDYAVQKISDLMEEVAAMFDSRELDFDFDLSNLEEVQNKMERIDTLLSEIEEFDVPETITESLQRTRDFLSQTADALVEVEKARKEEEKARQDEEKARKEEKEKALKDAQDLADKRFAIEQQLAKNRLSLQADTLSTRLAMLKLEMEAEIREAKKSGIKVQEQLAEIDSRYRQRIEDETKVWLNETADAYNAAVNERMKSENNLISNMADQLRAQYDYLNNGVFAKNTNTRFVSNIIESFYNPNETYPKLLEDEQKYLATIKTYRDGVYQDLLSIQREYQTELYNQQVYEETETFTRRKEELESEIEMMTKMSSKLTNVEKDALIAKQDELEMLIQTHNNTVENLERQKNLAIAQINEDADNERLMSQAKMQNRYLDSLSNWLAQISDEMSKVQEENINDWNIVNLSAYRENLTEIKEETEELIRYLFDKKEEIQALKDAGEIDFDTYVDGIRRVNDQIRESSDILKENDKKMTESIGDFLESINVYVQQALQAYSQISSAIFDKIDADLEAQIESIDALNDKLQDVLDKQLDMIKKHNDKINEIEGELGSARGDRRDQLIAAFNAEQIARERSFAEQKKIEKEQEQLQKRKELLEKKQRANQHKQQLSQAIVSAALATTNAYATQPFIPVGLAMGSLASALGAIQIGIIASTKYEKGGELPTKLANGGVIQGKSHQQGGVPVIGLSRPVEVEGNEFITNKKTTMMNIELLEFINSKKKRIDLADLVSFYYDKPSGNGKSTQAKQKYADGGTLPVMNTIGLTNSTNRIVVDMDDKPIYVSVTEFERVQENLHNVKTIAGY